MCANTQANRKSRILYDLRGDILATTRSSHEKLLRLVSGYPAAVVVLAAYFLIAANSVCEKSNTYDEIAHVTAGYSYWMDNDYRLQPENGILPQRWFAIPLLSMNLAFPRDAVLWTRSDVWKIGPQFFFESRNDMEGLLWRARCMNVLLSVGLGLLIYAWSRRLFGAGGGMLSLLCYTMNPTVLANGSLATSDMAAALFFTASIGCLWKMFHKISLGSVVCTWLALAGLFLSKMSAGLIIPMGVLLLVLRLIGQRPLLVKWKKEISIDRWYAQAGVIFGVMILQIVLVFVTIWAFYGFRYSAFHEPVTGKERFYYYHWDEMLPDKSAPAQAVKFAKDHHLLPEAYLYGALYAYQRAQSRSAFLNGEYSNTGWWYFFPYTFLVKTPLALFPMLLLAGAGAFWSWRQVPPNQWRTIFRLAWQAFYMTAPLWILLVFYWTTAIHSKLNIGHRHILPTYPAMFILTGAVAHWFYQRGRLGWIMSLCVLACMLSMARECYAIYPHYLAYFNSIAGGPSNGYRHLVDSSLDWGQDLPGLKRWLKEHDLDGQGKTPVYLAYFGKSSPDYYQIHAREICSPKSPPMAPWTEGVYCISATDLACVYKLTLKYLPWSVDLEKAYRERVYILQQFKTADAATRNQMIQAKGEAFWQGNIQDFEMLRFCRLCAYLRQREPDDNVGYSILIYRLSDKDIQDALYGPPPGLDVAMGPVKNPDQTSRQSNFEEVVANNNRAWMLATSPDASVRNGAEAVTLAQRAVELSGGREPVVFNTLAAAYAEAGRFPEAMETARKALDLATQQNKQALVESIKAKLQLYEANTPFRSTDSTPSNKTTQP